MKKRLIFLFIIISVFAVRAQETDGVTLLSPTEFKTQTEGKAVQLIDVRTSEEFQEDHIEGALNIDFYSENFEDNFQNLDKEQPVYLYCRSGYRSNQSAIKLKAMGFKDIYDLEGGILNYNKEKQ